MHSHIKGLFVLVLLGYSYAYPSGAPSNICGRYVPGGHRNRNTPVSNPQTGPYALTVQPSTGGTYRVTLQGTQGNPFKGFVIQGMLANPSWKRFPEGAADIVGSFQSAQSNAFMPQPSPLRTCMGMAGANVITHTNSDNKFNAEVIWTPPQMGSDPNYKLIATVVRDFDTFYVVYSDVINTEGDMSGGGLMATNLLSGTSNNTVPVPTAPSFLFPTQGTEMFPSLGSGLASQTGMNGLTGTGTALQGQGQGQTGTQPGLFNQFGAQSGTGTLGTSTFGQQGQGQFGQGQFRGQGQFGQRTTFPLSPFQRGMQRRRTMPFQPQQPRFGQPQFGGQGRFGGQPGMFGGGSFGGQQFGGADFSRGRVIGQGQFGQTDFGGFQQGATTFPFRNGGQPGQFRGTTRFGGQAFASQQGGPSFVGQGTMSQFRFGPRVGQVQTFRIPSQNGQFTTFRFNSQPGQADQTGFGGSLQTQGQTGLGQGQTGFGGSLQTQGQTGLGQGQTGLAQDQTGQQFSTQTFGQTSGTDTFLTPVGV